MTRCQPSTSGSRIAIRERERAGTQRSDPQRTLQGLVQYRRHAGIPEEKGLYRPGVSELGKPIPFLSRFPLPNLRGLAVRPRPAAEDGERAVLPGRAVVVNVPVGGVWRSTDGGAAWRSPLDTEDDVHQVCVLPVGPGGLTTGRPTPASIGTPSRRGWRRCERRPRAGDHGGSRPFDRRGDPVVSVRVGYAEWAGIFRMRLAWPLAGLPPLGASQNDRQDVRGTTDPPGGTGRTRGWPSQRGVQTIDGVTPGGRQPASAEARHTTRGLCPLTAGSGGPRRWCRRRPSHAAARRVMTTRGAETASRPAADRGSACTLLRELSDAHRRRPFNRSDHHTSDCSASCRQRWALTFRGPPLGDNLWGPTDEGA